MIRCRNLIAPGHADLADRNQQERDEMLHVAERARTDTRENAIADPAAALAGSTGIKSKLASSSKRYQGRATLPSERRESEPLSQAWARRHEQHCLAAIEMLDH